jgi:hypothetical protein
LRHALDDFTQTARFDERRVDGVIANSRNLGNPQSTSKKNLAAAVWMAGEN